MFVFRGNMKDFKEYVIEKNMEYFGVDREKAIEIYNENLRQRAEQNARVGRIIEEEKGPPS